jgi:hypothetical protein
LGLSIQEVARQSGVKFNSARNVFLGVASNKQVYPVKEFMKVSWKALHDFDIPIDLPDSEFHLAVFEVEV